VRHILERRVKPYICLFHRHLATDTGRHRDELKERQQNNDGKKDRPPLFRIGQRAVVIGQQKRETRPEYGDHCQAEDRRGLQQGAEPLGHAM
jgi:hypothetical protein